MTLSDGTTDVEIDFADEQMLSAIEQSTDRAGNGDLKAQTNGERLKFAVKVAATPEQYRALMDLLKNRAVQYYYTPEETYDFYEDVTFPIAVQVTNFEREWDNRGIYYLRFNVEAVEIL